MKPSVLRSRNNNHARLAFMMTHQKPGPRRWCVWLCCALGLGIGAARADTWHLKIDGIPGEQIEPGLHDWPPVKDFAARANVSINPTNRMPAAPVFACEIRKTIDRLSPLLMEGCANGQIYRRLILASEPTNGVQYRIIFDSVRIGAVNQHTSADASMPGIEETVAVQFAAGRIELARLDTDRNGGVTGGLTAVFDPPTGQGKLKPRLPFQATMTHDRGGAGIIIRWPAEAGHRYQIWSRTALAEPWKPVATYSGLEDGPASYFIATATPLMFLRVEEAD